MKKILLLAILITIADTTFATVIVCDHESSGVTVTGVWEFVHADGSVSNATWTHDNVDRRCLRSQEGIDYAKSRGKTGLLSMWWDKDKKRPHHFEEYLDGQKNGYSTALYTNGRIAFVGQFCKGMVVSGMWLRKDGTRMAEIIWKGDTGVSIDRDADGRIKSIEDFVPGHLPEERRISTNKNRYQHIPARRRNCSRWRWMNEMKSRFIIIACGLCIGFAAIAEKQERGPLIRTVYRALQDKPETTIHVTPADAEAFWQRLVPPTLTEQPTELHEFKRTHAHMFWEPYADKRITVSGGPYCPCCFFAAIGYSGKGYSAGWTIRLDDYIAIGFPEGSTAHPAHFSSAHLPHVLMSSALGSTSCSDFTRQLCIGLNWRISLLT